MLSCTHWSPGMDYPGVWPIKFKLQNYKSYQKCISIWIVVFSCARSKNWSTVSSLPVPGISLHNWSLHRLQHGHCRVTLHGSPAEVLTGNGGVGMWMFFVIQNELHLSIFQMSPGSWVCCCGSSWVLHKLSKTQDPFVTGCGNFSHFSCSD